MRVAAHGVVPVRFLARVEQEAHDFDMAELGREGKRPVTVLAAARWKEPAYLLHPSQGSRHDQIDTGTTPEECLHCIELSVHCRCSCRAAGVGSVVAKKIDQWDLDTTLAGYVAAGDQLQRLIECGLGEPSLEDDLGYGNNVRGETAAARWVFRDKLEQRWIAKVVATFEGNPTPNQTGMVTQVGAQPLDISGVEKVDRPPECRVRNSLLVRHVQAIGGCRSFNSSFQSPPTREPTFACNGELRVGDPEGRGKDVMVTGLAEARVKLPDPLGGIRAAASVFSQQVFGLMFEMIEIGMGWEGSYGHNELPFLRPRSAFLRAES